MSARERQLEQENATLRAQLASLTARPMAPSSSPRAQSPRATPGRSATRWPGVDGSLSPRSPVPGMSHDHMIRQAQLRQAHNRQRAQLKEYLQVGARHRGSGCDVTPEQLRLSAKLAGMPLPEHLILNSAYSNKYTTARGPSGQPEALDWRRLCKAIDYPALEKPDATIKARTIPVPAPHPLPTSVGRTIG